MKTPYISIFRTVLLSSVLCLTACHDDNNDSPDVPDNVTPKRVLSLGKPVSNPISADRVKTQTGRDDLKSFRRITDDFYYMNFNTDLKLQDLYEADYRTASTFENAVNSMLYTHPEEEDFGNPEEMACSGFICQNPGGEILFGRNFDGTYGSLVLIFNRGQKYKYVQFTCPAYSSQMYRHGMGISDKQFCDGKTSLHHLLRDPLASMDGMNEYGLCYGYFQLPAQVDIPEEGYVAHEELLFQNTGKKAINSALVPNQILGNCKTVKEVIEFYQNSDMINLHPLINVHTLVADATGDWAILEYWMNELHVYREADLRELYNYGDKDVPYEWRSIENYLFAKEPYTTFVSDPKDYDEGWQMYMTSKVRIKNMMSHYTPIMTEEDALKCLQEGCYGLEEEGDLTDWSVVYNPVQRTILFNLHNDMSRIYTIDLKEDL